MKIPSVKKLNIGIYGVASTREEIGNKCVKVAGYRLNPEITVSLDAVIAIDLLYGNGFQDRRR